MRISKTLVLRALFLILFSRNAFCTGEEEMGQTAEQANKFREALTHYAAALQSVAEGSVDDQKLREKIIAVAKKLDPPPAISEEAKRFMVRGKTLLEHAKNEQEAAQAVQELEKASVIAPWWSDLYFNLGIACEAAAQYEKALRNFNLYLQAAPDAPEAEQVKEKIYSIEVLAEKARTEEEKKSKLENLKGLWASRTPDSSVVRQYTVSLDSDRIKIDWSFTGSSLDKMESTANFIGKYWFEGTLKDDTISGTYYKDMTGWTGGRVFSYPFTGQINADQNNITLQCTDINITGATGMVPDGWREYPMTIELNK